MSGGEDRIEIADVTTFAFEKKRPKYDVIILDPPYFSEEEYRNSLQKKTAVWNKKNTREKTLYNLNLALYIDRIFQYAYSNPCWLVIFYKRRFWLAKDVIIWVREKEALGFTIKRNAEYVHLVNYQGLTLQTLQEKQLNEVEFIPKPRTRTCAKPRLLYEKIFRAVDAKRIFDPFAGWANSVIAARNLGLAIDVFDLDSDLQERFAFLKNYSPAKISDYCLDTKQLEVSD